MQQTDNSQKIYYTLRIAVAMCFIGHGAFGIITKPIWCNYFGVVGIDHALAYKLMPVVGSFDILMGILILVYPMRILAVWLVFWGLLTASMRPLSGEPFPELIERAGNFGAPLALLLLCGIKKNIGNLFTPMQVDAQISRQTLTRVIVCLRVVVFLLLAGHGWLNLIEKKALLNQYIALGFPNPSRAAFAVGVFEIIAAFSVLIKPIRPLLFIFFVWKTSSELFYPQYGIFEWIERGGSYGALLALWFATGKNFYTDRLKNIRLFSRKSNSLMFRQ